MTAYLRSWLATGTSASDEPSTPTATVPRMQRTSSPSPDIEIEEDEDIDEGDTPPAFPSLSSAQRTSSFKADEDIPRILTDTDLMPPPPPPNLAARRPGTSLLKPLATPSSSLAVPTTTTKRPPQPTKKRAKVGLAPGHSPLDWANLKSSGEDLRGVDTLMRISPSVLKTHNKRDDAWSAFSGKVYNITPYLSFHPGGEKELMRVAGRDGTNLFASTHAWVNVDYMLDACLVGFLVPEPAS